MPRGKRKPLKFRHMGLGVAFLFGNKPSPNERGAVLEQYAEKAAGPIQGV